MNSRLIFFHGFLGLPQDWQQVTDKLNVTLPPICVDLNRLQYSRLSPEGAGELIAEQILEDVSEPELVLIGYSMGGRLLLETLTHLQSRRLRTILISTNLQPLTDSERLQRKNSDKAWSERFISDSFVAVMNAWNSQEVFQGSVGEPDRKASDYDRQVLANQLINWSLSNQSDLLAKAIAAKALYIAGEKDVRYQRFISQWGPKSGLTIKNAPRSGHRVLFDNPEFLSEIIQQY